MDILQDLLPEPGSFKRAVVASVCAISLIYSLGAFATLRYLTNSHGASQSTIPSMLEQVGYWSAGVAACSAVSLVYLQHFAAPDAAAPDRSGSRSTRRGSARSRSPSPGDGGALARLEAASREDELTKLDLLAGALVLAIAVLVGHKAWHYSAFDNALGRVPNTPW